MIPRRKSILLLCILLAVTWLLGGAAIPPAAEEKEAVTDGHVIHDVGQIGNHVTNWGLIGSAPTAGAVFSDSPSAMWPIWSGNEYLWAAGLWVGGVRLGEHCVTTGGFQSEFLPTDAPGDTIYPTAHGAIGGNRFPWPIPDDDHDGVEDEELLNGLDDDGDGLVDEDFAAIGDQHFISAYNDFQAATGELYPDHYPLGLEVVQQSIQWSSPLGEDFIGFDFTITNTSVVAIEQVYLGMFSDFDIGPRGLPYIAEDDFAGYVSTLAQASDGSWVPVQAAYMYDGYQGGGYGGLDGYAAWVLCGHTTDPAGVSAPAEANVTGFQRFSGQAAFEDGGDPTNDFERYELLSRNEIDPDVPSFQQDDYRVLMSSGPFPSLDPGESISYQVALVLGLGLDEMIANAAEAVATYRGQSYDRDGDPANGEEFTVHWLPAEDAPVPASTGEIMAQAVPGGVELLIETNLDQREGLVVVRLGSSGVTERRWTGQELTAAGASGRNQLYRLLDVDPAGWPRTYQLMFEASGASLALDQLELDQPDVPAVQLAAGPNPFNPLLNIRFSQAQPGHLLLQVFDLRGRLVRTLVDEHRDPGMDVVVWRGDDEAGRAAASGVYQLRLITGGELLEKRVTLVR